MKIIRFALLLCMFGLVTSTTVAQKKKKGSSHDNCQLDDAKKMV